MQIVQPEKAPAVIPFGGDQPENPYPMEIDISAKPKKASGQYDYQMASFKPLTATIDLDNGTQRAEQGTHWIRVTVRVTATGNTMNISSNTVLLVVDGDPMEAEEPSIEHIDNGESVDVAYLFALPDDAAELGLQVGTPADTPNNTLKTFPLDLPDLPDVTPAMS